ncbi:hypothetical protein C4552_00615 [Candidatus Parcubacteria bacterium]|nr:MAG: hypothetical protein C4552_00615 [Candidatus Parcubacteria bacterium]
MKGKAWRPKEDVMVTAKLTILGIVFAAIFGIITEAAVRGLLSDGSATVLALALSGFGVALAVRMLRNQEGRNRAR